MTIIRSDIPELMLKGLNTVFGLLPPYPPIYPEYYSTHRSEMQQETDVEYRSLGMADIKDEGDVVAMDTMATRIKQNYIHRTVAIGFSVSMEALQDNQYRSEFPQQAKALRTSMQVAKDTLGANVLNNAFNPAYVYGDGQPLCSTVNPVDGGVYANAFGAGTPYVDFSEAGVEQAIIGIGQFVSQSGLLTNTKAKKLGVPKELQFAAARLLQSTNRIDTNNNDINAIYTGSYIPEGFFTNYYLTSPTAWFIFTGAENGMKHYQRMDVEIDVYKDFATKSMMCSAVERYSFGASNKRAIWGSPGA